MFKSDISYAALLLENTRSIHTCFMKFNIDACFLDKNFKIIKVYKNLKPWRMTNIIWRAKYVLEIPSHSNQWPIKEGDRLEVHCIN
jgi:uncharacterized membrane protein (UPF0127 family)